MRPVTQIRTGYGRGQCTEAAIASILEVELNEVPDLWAGPHVPLSAPPRDHQPLERHEALWAWLKDRGRMWCWGEFAARPLPLNPADYPHLDWLPWEGHHLMAGPNPDGVEHMVVGKAGRLAWDPNPTRRGIVACNAAGFLLPLDDCPPEWLDWPGVALPFDDVEAA